MLVPAQVSDMLKFSAAISEEPAYTANCTGISEGSASASTGNATLTGDPSAGAAATGGGGGIDSSRSGSGSSGTSSRSSGPSDGDCMGGEGWAGHEQVHAHERGHVHGHAGNGDRSPLPADYCVQLEGLKRAVRGPGDRSWGETAPTATAASLSFA